MSTRSQRRARGFSLVEILVAIGVCSIGLMGTTAALLYGVRGQTISGRHTVATNYARHLMEIIRTQRLAFNGAPINENGPVRLDAPIAGTPIRSQFVHGIDNNETPWIFRSIQMKRLGATDYHSKVMEVTVKIHWKDRHDTAAGAWKEMAIVSHMVEP